MKGLPSALLLLAAVVALTLAAVLAWALLARPGAEVAAPAAPVLTTAGDAAGTGAAPPAADLAREGARDAARRAAEAPSAAPEEEDEPEDLALVVRALDEAGGALAGVAVSPTLRRHRGPRRSELQRALTGADGTARWPVEPALLEVGDELSVHLHAGPGERPDVTWAGPWPGEPLDVVLPRAGALEGVATFAESGARVESGRVSVRWQVSERAGGSTTAAVRDGAYRVEGVAGRVHSVGLVRPGHRYLSVEPGELAIPPGGTARFDPAFAEGPLLLLRILAAGARTPVAGATVRAGSGPAAKTDDACRAVVRGAFPGRREQAWVEVRAIGFAPLEQLVPRERAGTGLEVELELDAGSVVEGVVVDAANLPVAGVTVIARRTELFGLGGVTRHTYDQRTRTDDAGRFRLVGLPACDDLDLLVVDDPRPVAWERLRLPEDAGERVVVVPAGRALSGEVLDAAGEPVSGVDVLASHGLSGASASARTDAQGRFTLTGLIPAEWWIAVPWGQRATWGGSYTYRRRVVHRVAVGRGEGWLSVRLPADAPPPEGRVELRVRVVDAATGEPLARIEWLQVTGVDSNFSVGVSGAALEEGVVHHEAPPGIHTVGVRARGYAPWLADVELRAGQGTEALEARLVPAPR